MTKNITKIATGLAKGIGAMVWWDLRNTLVRPADMRTILDTNGFDASIVPDIKTETAVRAAVVRWKSGDFQAEWLGVDDQDRMNVGILERVKSDTSKRVDRLQRVRLTYDPSAGVWDSQIGEPGVTLEHMAGPIESFQNFAHRKMTYLDAHWLRPKFLQPGFSEMDSFLIKSGMYYVPLAREEYLLRMQAVLDSLADASLYIMEVPDTDQARTAVSASARDNITAELNDAAEKLAEWRERMKEDNPRKIRSSSVGKMLATFTSLRDRVQLYSDALKVKFEDLDELIAETEQRAAAFFDAQDLNPPTPEVEQPEVKEIEVEEVAEVVPRPEPEPEPEPETIEYTAEALAELRAPQLREIAKAHKIRGRGRMKVDELRCAILQAQEGQVAA